MNFRIVFIFLLINNTVLGQNYVSISGRLSGSGDSTLVKLGNRGTGITQAFKDIVYDSVYTKGDSFHFRMFAFNEPRRYSVSTRGGKGWITFFIDEGQIVISGKKDSIYLSTVTGSHNNDIVKKFNNEIYLPWLKQNNQYRSRIQELSRIDTVQSASLQLKADSVRDEFRKKIFSIYDSLVGKKPFAAYEVLEYSQLHLLSDSALKHYFAKIPEKFWGNQQFESVMFRLFYKSKRTTPGSPFPDYNFIDQNGDSVSIQSVKSKYKLLVFWASWCGPCLEEIPKLDSINNLMQSKGLRMIAINVDVSESLWLKFISKYTFNILHFYQGGTQASQLYRYLNIQSIPHLVLLDEENKLIKDKVSIDDVESIIADNNR